MIEAVLVVLSKPRPGRDDDFNDWYTNIHLRDALRFRGSIAAQRYRRSDRQPHDLPAGFDWTYLALYDVFDAARFSREHWDNANTNRMMITDAFDDSVLEDYHYYPRQFHDRRPGKTLDEAVILEQLNPAGADQAAFESWYSGQYFAEAMQRPGVRSGALLVFRDQGQLMPTRPNHHHVGIFRLDDGAALAAWRDEDRLRGNPLVDQASLRVTHWEPITARITEDHVHHTSAAALEAEEQARARMGDRILRGDIEKLAVPNS